MLFLFLLLRLFVACSVCRLCRPERERAARIDTRARVDTRVRARERRKATKRKGVFLSMPFFLHLAASRRRRRRREGSERLTHSLLAFFLSSFPSLSLFRNHASFAAAARRRRGSVARRGPARRHGQGRGFEPLRQLDRAPRGRAARRARPGAAARQGMRERISMRWFAFFAFSLLLSFLVVVSQPTHAPVSASTRCTSTRSTCPRQRPEREGGRKGHGRGPERPCPRDDEMRQRRDKRRRRRNHFILSLFSLHV